MLFSIVSKTLRRALAVTLCRDCSSSHVSAPICILSVSRTLVSLDTRETRSISPHPLNNRQRILDPRDSRIVYVALRVLLCRDGEREPKPEGESMKATVSNPALACGQAHSGR